jgi:hypothetical protein
VVRQNHVGQGIGVVHRACDDADWPSGPPKQFDLAPPEALQKGLREGKVVTLDRWLKIDQAERQRAKDRI